ncbi:(deoxy)nucleoside triphosphate pyrophosphohydrolase [Blautia marasmi]|uniref:(deoxy)nucleoside triphosphate pyrophosphohydrolase n=1 Tax=Blautia marasmi TaxID=1917868 RepID=UPI000CF26D04|nr:(deoxy)nucleoside triphosphate pyrophosphohydrolase [Blautia marasmi]
MNTINVVAAVIKRDNKIFATQRGYGEFKGGWEFPGGKVEPGEAPKAALIREIREELNTVIQVHDMIGTIEYYYPSFHLNLCCYWCSLVSGKLELLEHEAARWLRRDELHSVLWLPADIQFLEKIQREL